MQLSKSNYMTFLRHPAWLWLEKHDKSKIPPVDENTQAIFDNGHAFEAYAEARFPEAITLGFDDYDSYLSLPERTKAAIKNGEKVLFQPWFVWSEYTCISDIVEFIDENTVDLYEVKASISAKPEHEYDLAFQRAVIEGNNLKIRNSFVICVDNTYVRRGEIEALKITKKVDITDKVESLSEVTKKCMPLALEVAKASTMPNPDPELAKLGSKKDWLKIYENLFPSEPKVWPEETMPIIQKDEIKTFPGELTYPLYFLDYETMMRLVPEFVGHRPYQQVPTQYSLHILKSPESELEHKEYLHGEKSDPARPLAEQLINDISAEGSIIVWYEGFEKARNKELGDMLPDYKKSMEKINNRVVDLMIPFKKKWYDDPRFEGSASIKKVLPVLCPELSYKNLDIQEGGSAQRLWMEAVLGELSGRDKEKNFDDLKKYCELDTLAMVRIFEVLVKSVEWNHGAEINP